MVVDAVFFKDMRIQAKGTFLECYADCEYAPIAHRRCSSVPERKCDREKVSDTHMDYLAYLTNKLGWSSDFHEVGGEDTASSGTALPNSGKASSSSGSDNIKGFGRRGPTRCTPSPSPLHLTTKSHVQNSTEAGGKQGLPKQEAAVERDTSVVRANASEAMEAPRKPSRRQRNRSPQATSQHGERATTAMICGLPCRITTRMLVDELSANGFESKTSYDFLYVPTRHGDGNLGYSFINFVGHQELKRFESVFDGYRFPGTASLKNCSVKPARIQGYAANVAQFASDGRRKGHPGRFEQPPFLAPRAAPVPVIEGMACGSLC